MDKEAQLMPGKPFLQHLFEVLEAQQAKKLSTSSTTLTRSNSSGRNLSESSVDFKLELNTPCLFYLESLFRAILQPVSNENGFITEWRKNASFMEGLDDDLDEEHLGAADPRRILRVAGHLLDLKAMSIHAMPPESNLQMPSECDLSLFASLQYLHIDRCDLGTIRNLDRLKLQLKELRFTNHPLSKLSLILGIYEPEWSDSETGTSTFSTWRQLYALHISNCSLTSLDASVALIPGVKVMNLSNNRLNRISQLQVCKNLLSLDLSYNRMSSMVGINRTLHTIRTLNLSHNCLKGTSGLEKLYSLQSLNLSYNLIESMSEVAYLVSLPLLHSLVLRGNPIEKYSMYRTDILTLLSSEVMLDDIPWSSTDLHDFISHKKKEPMHMGMLKQELRRSFIEQNGMGDLLLDAIRQTHEKDVKSQIEEKEAVAAAAAASQARREKRKKYLRLIVAACIVTLGSQLMSYLIWSKDSRDEEMNQLVLMVTTGVIGASVFVMGLFETAYWIVDKRRESQEYHAQMATFRKPLVRSPSSRSKPQKPNLVTKDIRKVVQIASPTNVNSNRSASRKDGSKQPLTPNSSSVLREIPRRLSNRFLKKVRSMSDPTPGEDVLSFEILLTSLQKLNDTSEKMSPLIFLNVCAEIGILLKFLGRGGSFAWNILERNVFLLEKKCGDLETSLRNTSLQELIHLDNTSSSLAAVLANEEGVCHRSNIPTVGESVARLLELFEFVNCFLNAFFGEENTPTSPNSSRNPDEYEEDAKVGSKVAYAYEQIFAPNHPWMIRKAILSATGLCSSSSGFWSALSKGNELDSEEETIEVIRENLQTGQSRLEMVCMNLKSFLDKENLAELDINEY